LAKSLTKIIRLTPPGRGAVAVMLLQGREAFDFLMRYWSGTPPRRENRENKENRPFFGRFRLDSIGQNEEIVVHFAAQDEIEIHSHGGEAVVTAIESALVREGAELVLWQDFFCSQHTQKELALQLLPFAPTERTARILLDQMDNVLDRELAKIERLPDTAEQLQHYKRLREKTELGKHLVDPFRVVLAGAGNAGKSSLLNTILGFQRSIVNAAAGTTRDIVSGQTAIDGFPVAFYDTAGFRETQHDLELQGIERSSQSLANADLVVWVVDSTVPKSEQLDYPAVEKKLICFNKIDLVNKQNRTENVIDIETIYVSAVTGEGVETLLEHVIRRLIPNSPKPFDAVPLVNPVR
jgi:tRNA modification GTPase